MCIIYCYVIYVVSARECSRTVAPCNTCCMAAAVTSPRESSRAFSHTAIAAPRIFCGLSKRRTTRQSVQFNNRILSRHSLTRYTVLRHLSYCFIVVLRCIFCLLLNIIILFYLNIIFTFG